MLVESNIQNIQIINKSKRIYLIMNKEEMDKYLNESRKKAEERFQKLEKLIKDFPEFNYTLLPPIRSLEFKRGEIGFAWVFTSTNTMMIHENNYQEDYNLLTPIKEAYERETNEELKIIKDHPRYPN